MSKKRIHIDELFRRGLGNMQMPVAGDDWAVMQAQIAAAQKERKRRRAIWWWLFGLLLVAGGSLSTYSILNSKENATSPLVVKDTPVTLPQNNRTNGITSGTENETFDIQNTTTAEDGANEGQNSANANNTNNSFADNTNRNNTSTSSNGRHSNVNRTTATDNGEPQSATQSGGDDENNTSTQNGEGTETNAADNGTSSNGNTPKPNDENPIPPAPAATQQSAVNTAIDSVPDDENNGEEAEQATAKETAVPPLPTKALKKLSIIQLGLGFVPTFVHWQTPQNTRYGQILKQGGKSTSSSGINFSADFRITNKWWIGSGVDISNIKSKGNYKYTHQIYDSIPVLGTGGEIKGYFHTNFRDTSHNYYLQSTYTFISIPIQTWYNFPLNQKTGILLGSNVQFHYLAMARGEYINPNTLFSQKATANNDQFRKLNFSVALQLGYYYTISNRWRFESVVQLQQMGKSLFSDNVGANVRLQSIGLNMGIVYNLMR